MRQDNLQFYSFRLNLDNPQHRKINDVIKDLNLSIFKSKNQFIADAVETYIDSFEKDDVTEEGSLRKAKQLGYINRSDLEKIKEEMRYELMSEVRNEVIKLLGGVVSGMQMSSNASVTKKGTKIEEEEDHNEVDETLEKLALDWS